MKSRVRLLSVLAAVATIAAVSVGPRATASTSGLSKYLLTTSQVPRGWTVYSGPVPLSSPKTCLSPTLKPTGVRLLDQSWVHYTSPTSDSLITEIASMFAPTNEAFGKIVATLQHCTRIAYTSHGQPVTGSVRKTSFPGSDAAISAFTITLHRAGQSAEEYFIVATVKSVILEVIVGGRGAPNLTQVQAVVKAAVGDAQRVPESGVVTTTTQKFDSLSSCQGDGMTVEVAMSAFSVQHPGVVVTESGLLSHAGTGPYIQRWPDSATYRFIIASGVLYVAATIGDTHPVKWMGPASCQKIGLT